MVDERLPSQHSSSALVFLMLRLGSCDLLRERREKRSPAASIETNKKEMPLTVRF